MSWYTKSDRESWRFVSRLHGVFYLKIYLYLPLFHFMINNKSAYCHVFVFRMWLKEKFYDIQFYYVRFQDVLFALTMTFPRRKRRLFNTRLIGEHYDQDERKKIIERFKYCWGHQEEIQLRNIHELMYCIYEITFAACVMLVYNDNRYLQMPCI